MDRRNSTTAEKPSSDRGGGGAGHFKSFILKPQASKRNSDAELHHYREQRDRAKLPDMGTPLDNEQYISLETFKKDGTGVKTPVWAAPLDGKLVIGTGADSFKVKRIRNNARVRVAACNASGSKITGPWYEGKARIAEANESPRFDAALNAKYGLQRRIFSFFSRMFRRVTPAMIEVTVEGEAGKSS